MSDEGEMSEVTTPLGPSLRERDGTNPIEKKAVYRAQVEIRSMPASLVVQIALWPDKLADWAKEMGVAPAVVYNMLAGVKPYHRVRTLLARRLNVSKHVLDHLVDASRPEPLAKVPPDPPGAVSAPPRLRPEPVAASAPDGMAGVPDEPAERVRVVSHRRPSRRSAAAASASQITLNI
jgi:hypothetical protein